MGIMEFDFKSQGDEIANSSSYSSKAKTKNVKGIIFDAVGVRGQKW